MGVMGIEAIVALIGVVITVPSTIFAIWNYLQQRKSQSRRSTTSTVPTASDCAASCVPISKKRDTGATRMGALGNQWRGCILIPGEHEVMVHCSFCRFGDFDRPVLLVSGEVLIDGIAKVLVDGVTNQK
ncbi:hypothetical protein QBC42DRAFT_318468 [Cladorrhinum samala]|uniref:Uncharacterized protein n=1 Tax=Cladorrhinum samala TaxID=585594 RepID=A0AAV9HCW5_9PEZI|nr:hypothetical protein QBC42DRAFT_318468 [Cladorrhinum samala]